MQKIPKNSKILKNDGHFRIPHPQISFKQFSNICKNVVDILPLPHTVISNSEKLTHPSVQCTYIIRSGGGVEILMLIFCFFVLLYNPNIKNK